MATEYKLKSPIVLGAETINALALEEPDLGKLIDAGVSLDEKDLMTAEGMGKLIEACCTNATSAHIRKMKFSDLTPAVEICSGFFTE